MGVRNAWGETSLVAQWVRLLAPKAGDLGSIFGQRTRSHMPPQRPRTAQYIQIYIKKKTCMGLMPTLGSCFSWNEWGGVLGTALLAGEAEALKTVAQVLSWLLSHKPD